MKRFATVAVNRCTTARDIAGEITVKVTVASNDAVRSAIIIDFHIAICSNHVSITCIISETLPDREECFKWITTGKITVNVRLPIHQHAHAHPDYLVLFPRYRKIYWL